ncbi:sucrose synthase [Acidithiobacillus sp.]|jgi:sucrose synthase|uniref:sucrose synthase n=1 Tax=Acidithiobacillus sp. TaxID=1872118 RepID=UPI0025B8258A|nr:sucrose synthase [Acidithiobacillus sp.]MCK9187787.1 sucrose synthase [Acidithiobacillus sp.]MCK9358677.1 sucrose synthase [Acidithiobacillus sp.]
MSDDLRRCISQNAHCVAGLLRHLFNLQRPFLLYTDLQKAISEFAADYGSDAELVVLQEFFSRLQEAVLAEPWIYLAWRPGPGRWTYLRLHREQLNLETLTPGDYLAFKERQVLPANDQEPVLTVDFEDFRAVSHRLHDEATIGQGLMYMNRRLAGQLFGDIKAGRQSILDFLAVHKLNGQSLMVHDQPPDFEALRRTVQYLATLPKNQPWTEFAVEMTQRGFAPGWGDTAGRVRETMRLLMDLLDAPSAESLQAFIDRIPMISKILIVSIHGWFAQDKVLGRPDTGGQVVYILDQARALELEMRQRLARQGVDIVPRILIATRLIPNADGTTCDQRLESVQGADNVQILRVPFRYSNGEILPQWISRFNVWPWLERYADDLERETLAEFGRRPDLIIGNYSDGNLVAAMLSARLNVTQCNIAHALEKSKYLYSDLYWRDHDASHHFACQFTADLIAMNSADIIVTSTYQEIAGNDREVGQYEGHQNYSLPGLYRVENGIDVFDTKFNIVSPGADAHYYFPYSASAARLRFLHEDIDALLFGEAPAADRRGVLKDRDKPIIFSMARMDHIKNLSGLAELFGASERLRKLANLVIVGGHVDPQNSQDEEERAQIQRTHDMMDAHQLDGQMRWIGTLLDKNVAGELYRIIGDTRGCFVQPALFEAFGLTVIEAMSSGLPVFATRFGGPLEIIEDGVSGFHIDPNNQQETAEKLADFLEAAAADIRVWETISDGALARVSAHYTWGNYATQMMTLARIFGFWRFMLKTDHHAARRYLQMFQHLQWRPLAHAVPLGES